MLFDNNKTLEIEVRPDFHKQIKASAEAVNMTVEQFAMTALTRLVDEQETRGAIICGKAHSVPTIDGSGNNHPLTIHVSPLQHTVLSKVADRYGATLEQAAKYGLFYFEHPLAPDDKDGKTMLEDIMSLKDPEALFEARYEDEISEAIKAAEDAIEAERAEAEALEAASKED